MKKQQILKNLRSQIIAANGKRHAHIISPEKAEEIYEVYMQARAEVRALGHDANTVHLLYDPNCVPGCYKWQAKTTMVSMSVAAIKRGMAFEDRLEKRPRGCKWAWKITFTPNDTNAVPEGFSKTGVKRI